MPYSKCKLPGSRKKSVTVIDLVDSDVEDSGHLYYRHKENSQRSDIPIPGSMVITPYGIGQILETETSHYPKNSEVRLTRKRSLFNEDNQEVFVNIKVQLTYGIGYLNKSVIKSIPQGIKSDTCRCLPRMMLNDNVINFALKNLRNDFKISNDIIIADSYAFELIRKYLFQKGLANFERRRKILKVLNIGDVTRVKSAVIPISSQVKKYPSYNESLIFIIIRRLTGVWSL